MYLEQLKDQLQRPAVILAAFAVATTIAIGGSQAVAAAEVSPPHETPQFIDGKEFTDQPGGPTAVEQEQQLADNCRKAGRVTFSKFVSIRPTIKDTMHMATIAYNQSDVSKCNGYIARTAVYNQLETRVAGQQNWTSGDPVLKDTLDNDGHKGIIEPLPLGQVCKPGATLQARVVTKTRDRSLIVGYKDPAFAYNKTDISTAHSRIRTLHCARNAPTVRP